MSTGEATLEVRSLGGKGDGVCVSPDDGQAVFVPGALPGEAWRRHPESVTGWERVTASPARVVPECPHYSVCGGCLAQHMSDQLYRDWKTSLVASVFSQHGLEVAVGPLVRIDRGTRRRVVFAGRVGKRAGPIVGFHQSRTHDVFDASACTIANTSVLRSLDISRELLRAIGESADRDLAVRIVVLGADNGLDLVIEKVGHALPSDVRRKLAAICEAAGVLRLTVDRQEIVQFAAPVIQCGTAEVVPPPGAFVQAVRAAEAAMVDAVTAGLKRAKHIADLFSGIGTFSFPLAAGARVDAIDSSDDALAALGEAVRRTQGLKPVTTRRRDLFREPLSRGELKAYDGVVLDPPRAGCAEQADALAKSSVPRIAAVSCNPTTLARDARILVDGGYKLRSVTPIDQFLFSAHVEAVAIFER